MGLEMAQQLKALTVLADNLGSIPSTHMAAINCLRPGVVVYTFNPTTREAEEGRSL